MKNAGLAEWLLRRVTTPDRASAQVGDLLEQASSRSAGWFWREVSGSLIRQGWRGLFAILLAVGSAEWLSSMFMHHFREGLEASLRRYEQTHVQPHMQTWSPGPVFGTLLLPALAIPAVYCVVRFGIRDRLTSSFLIATCGACLFAFDWQQAVTRWSLPIAFAAASLLVAFPRNRRQLVRAFFGSMATSIFFQVVSIVLFGLFSFGLLKLMGVTPPIAFHERNTFRVESYSAAIRIAHYGLLTAAVWLTGLVTVLLRNRQKRRII